MENWNVKIVREHSIVNQLYHTTSNERMKVSSMLVISVTSNLHYRVVWQLISSPYMKVSSMLVTSVTFKLHNRVIWKLIFNLNMNVWSMTVLTTQCDQQFTHQSGLTHHIKQKHLYNDSMWELMNNELINKFLFINDIYPDTMLRLARLEFTFNCSGSNILSVSCKGSSCDLSCDISVWLNIMFQLNWQQKAELCY